jgi:hypothetical protein
MVSVFVRYLHPYSKAKDIPVMDYCFGYDLMLPCRLVKRNNDKKLDNANGLLKELSWLSGKENLRKMKNNAYLPCI